jgi:hypothetical protein
LTATAPPALRIVTFGDLVAGLWGAVWSAPQPAFALGSLEQQLSGSATLDASDEDGEWRISGDGVELVVSPVGEVVHNATFDGFDQLGRVRGQVALAGAEVAVDVLGRRGARFALELREAGSVRDVSSFFEPDQGLALTAVRPRKTRGHDRDLVAAAVLDVGSEHEVSDPRLSTTYTADGVPARAGLELWLSDDEDAEQYPRRAAGEAVGAGVATGDADLEVRAEGFRWHSRGTEGSGVYLLMRPR